MRHLGPGLVVLVVGALGLATVGVRAATGLPGTPVGLVAAVGVPVLVAGALLTLGILFASGRPTPAIRPLLAGVVGGGLFAVALATLALGHYAAGGDPTDVPPFALVDWFAIGALAGTGAAVLDNRRRIVDRRKEEYAVQNERLREFADVVAHDLRNPLNVAEGSLELAKLEGGADATGDEGGSSADGATDSTDDGTGDGSGTGGEHIERAQGALGRMNDLIDEMLTLARQGETVAEIEPVALGSLADECWAGVDTGDARLLTATDRMIYADEGRLRQLLENLMRNAVEHGSTSPRSSSTREDAVEHAGPEVTVTVGAVPGGFYVADDGPGVPSEDREELFDPGYTTAEDGTGFGLAIVQEVVDAHGWAIAVTDSEDGGARFEVTGVDMVL